MAKTTRDYLKTLMDSGTVSSSEMRKFYLELKKTAESKGLPMKTGEDLNNIMTQMDSAIANKYPKIFEKFQTAGEMYDLEKSIGTNKTDYINRETNPDNMQQEFSDNLDRIKNDPKYQEFRGKYEGFLQEDYGLTLESIDGKYELTKQSLDQQKEIAKQQYNNLKEDVAKYTQYAKDDYVTDLAKTDNQLSGALQNATESYGQKNLLQSGLSRIAKQNTIGEGTAIKGGLQTSLNRRISDLVTQQQRGKQSYYNNLEGISMKEQGLEQDADLNRRIAGLRRDESAFDIENKKDEQAYSQTIYQQQQEQNSRINQVLKNLYK